MYKRGLFFCRLFFACMLTYDDGNHYMPPAKNRTQPLDTLRAPALAPPTAAREKPSEKDWPSHRLELSAADKVTTILFYLYIFMLGVSLLGASFKLFGTGLAEHIFTATANPVLGLAIGILTTVLVQSSSTTTALTVGLVGSGVLSPTHAIPILLGSNIGTTVTNTIISIGSIRRGQEFQRAFAAATVHDVFNVIAVVILFPLHLYTNFLSHGAQWMTARFADAGGLKLMSPLSFALSPAEQFIITLLHQSAFLVLLVAVVMMFGGLHKLVQTLKALILTRLQTLFDTYIFKTAVRSFLFGVVLTIAVQSSSISTSVMVPLAAAGILTLHQIFPFTLGANIGTTITAMLASLATGNPAAVIAAFAHVLFNICGVAVIYPIRSVPIYIANRLGILAVRNRWLPFAYIAVVFIGLPLFIYLIL
jgi:solute carrier family 34 (sodium-dependent phosphate cotransporter)